MKITKTENGTSLTLALDGRLDTLTAKDLEAENKASLSGKADVTYDFEKLAYVSSAGLRVLLQAHKAIKASGGTLKLIHVNDNIREILEVTGFLDFFNVD